MEINESLMSESEKIQYGLRSLYYENGYEAYHMTKFEEYDLYAGNKDFLVSDNVITFTDTNGKLMALKPDVTLSIIKNHNDMPEETRRVYYHENVYRVAGGNSDFREMMQVGLECFGRVSEKEICEVIGLAVKSLGMLPGKPVLEISSLEVLEAAIENAALSGKSRRELCRLVSSKNREGVKELLEKNDVSAEIIRKVLFIMNISGTIRETLPLLEECCGSAEFIEILKKFDTDENSNVIRVDLSVFEDTYYYNGIVFKGYVSGVPEAVLSGGQYDRLMGRMKRRSRAVGFAVYTDALDRMKESADEEEKQYLNVALPKGRLGEKVYSMFEQAGYECPSLLEPNRKLIFENSEKKVRYFWVKPSDVAIYVERGAADIGVAGKDILEEYKPDVYELLNLKKGVCRMAVAAPLDFVDDHKKTLVVATKFAEIAKAYYRKQGRDIDIIHLNGSIEIAPILKLSDVIVDIVETGTTLKENNLKVFEEIMPISARLIANRASYKFKKNEIDRLTAGMAAIVED